MLPSLLTANPSSASAKPKKTNSAKPVWVLPPPSCVTLMHIISEIQLTGGKMGSNTSLDWSIRRMDWFIRRIEGFILTYDLWECKFRLLSLFYITESPRCCPFRNTKGVIMDSVGVPGTAEVSAEQTPGPTTPLAKSRMGSLSFQVLTFTLCLKSISEEGRWPTASNKCGNTGDTPQHPLHSGEIQHWHTEINRAAQIWGPSTVSPALSRHNQHKYICDWFLLRIRLQTMFLVVLVAQNSWFHNQH